MLELQRTIGNVGVCRLLDGRAVQAKLVVGPAGDLYEREADDVADEVVRRLGRAEVGAAEVEAAEVDEEHGVRRSSRATSTVAADEVVGLAGGALSADAEHRIHQARGGGRSLPEHLRHAMESALGAELGGTRVHVSGEADDLNRSMQSKAFTVGRDIFFARGQFQPGSRSGQRLLAHELTHTLQQGVANTAGGRRQVGRGGVRRAFEPARVTDNAHFRKSKEATDDTPLKVKTGIFGRTGDKLKAGHELMVDDADKSGTWIRAVDVDAAGWDPASKASPTKEFIRQSKVQKIPYPRGTAYWHEDLGEFEKLHDSPSTANAWLVKRNANNKVFKYDATGRTVVATEEKLFSYEDNRLLGNWTDYGNSPDDGRRMVKLRLGQAGQYFKAVAGDIHRPAERVTLSTAENIQVIEKGSQRQFDERVALDPRLKTAQGAMTENLSYRSGRRTVIIKVLGNPGDEHYNAQLQAIRGALTALASKRVPLQSGLKFVISSSTDPGFRQEAFHFGAGAIVLTPKMFHDPGVAHAEEDIGIKGGVPGGNNVLGVAHQLARGVGAGARPGVIGIGVVIHEVGHVMHKIMKPAEFVEHSSAAEQDDLTADEKRVKQKATATTMKVSHYAWSAGAPPTELVAEVFTGITAGEKYPPDVIALYKKYGGPTLWTDESEVTAVTEPADFETVSLTGNHPSQGSVSHVFKWGSSTGSLIDIAGMGTREHVKFDTDPVAFMPAYKSYRDEGGMAKLTGNLLLKTGVDASKGTASDNHSPGWGPFFDDEIGFVKAARTLRAVQHYQYQRFNGSWRNIPDSKFVISRTLKQAAGEWSLVTKKVGQGDSATARVKMYDSRDDVPPALLGAH